MIMRIILKVKEWLKRYAAAEFFGLLVSVLFAYGGRLLHLPAVGVGYLGMMGANVGFYGIILFKEHFSHFKRDGFSRLSFYRTARNIFVEFGPAEYLDSFVVRPAFLSLFPLFLHNFALAIVLGNLAANITFYIPVIISYELRKKYWN